MIEFAEPLTSDADEYERALTLRSDLQFLLDLYRSESLASADDLEVIDAALERLAAEYYVGPVPNDIPSTIAGGAGMQPSDDRDPPPGRASAHGSTRSFRRNAVTVARTANLADVERQVRGQFTANRSRSLTRVAVYRDRTLSLAQAFEAVLDACAGFAVRVDADVDTQDSGEDAFAI